MSSIYVFFGLGFTGLMCVYWLGVFFILYHLIRFGVGTGPKRLSVFFLGGALFFSLITTILFTQVNFSSIHSVDFNPLNSSFNQQPIRTY